MEEQAKRKSRKPLIILASILLLMAGAGIFYWIESAHYETTDDAQLDGNIYSVRSGITAYLNKICFTDNQQVKKGDTLIIFDTIALKAKVEQAIASLENAKSKLSVSDIQALASLQSANASAQNALSEKETIAAAKSHLEMVQKNFNRDEVLIKINAVTQKQYDVDKTALAEANADFQQAVHQQKSAAISSTGLKSQALAAHHAISSSVAMIAENEAELKLAEEEFKHAFVVAPCDGIVTKRSVDQGQFVLSGQSLCAVVDENNLWVTANFKETQLHKIKPGQSVEISIDAYPNLNLKGVVQSYGGATGAKFALIPPDNATGNFIKVTQRFPLKIKISAAIQPDQKNNHQNSKVLFPGLSAFVKIKTN